MLSSSSSSSSRWMDCKSAGCFRAPFSEEDSVEYDCEPSFDSRSCSDNVTFRHACFVSLSLAASSFVESSLSLCPSNSFVVNGELFVWRRRVDTWLFENEGFIEGVTFVGGCVSYCWLCGRWWWGCSGVVCRVLCQGLSG